MCGRSIGPRRRRRGELCRLPGAARARRGRGARPSVPAQVRPILRRALAARRLPRAIRDLLMNAAELLLGSAALSRHGGRIALLSGEESLTFADLAQRVARAAAALAALGVRPGDRVLLLMRDTPEFAVAWLGAVRAGATAIALNNK